MKAVETFDVFEVLQDGQVMWYRAAANRAAAEKLARERAAQTKTTFFILNQQTSEKIFVNAQGVTPKPSQTTVAVQQNEAIG